MLVALFILAIMIIGAFLFAAVEWFEPNTRIAIILKCAILAAGGAVVANRCPSQPPLWWRTEVLRQVAGMLFAAVVAANGRAQARPLCFSHPVSSRSGPNSPDNTTDQSSGL